MLSITTIKCNTWASNFWGKCCFTRGKYPKYINVSCHVSLDIYYLQLYPGRGTGSISCSALWDIKWIMNHFNQITSQYNHIQCPAYVSGKSCKGWKQLSIINKVVIFRLATIWPCQSYFSKSENFQAWKRLFFRVYLFRFFINWYKLSKIF